MSLFNENFYTDDFDQEMIDYVDTLGNFTSRVYIGRFKGQRFLKYGKGNNYFWTDDGFFTNYKYLTKQQFKEKVGMTQKQFTKADLKTGMVVKYHGDKKDREDLSNKFGGLRLVVNNYAISSDNFIDLDDYENTMVYKEEPSFTIDEVFEVDSTYSGLNKIEKWTLKSIWKRPEPVEAPPVPSAEQIEIASIQAEMDKLSQRLSVLKGKI